MGQGIGQDLIENELAFARFLDWLRIPSASAVAAHAPDVERAATWICEHMREVAGSDLRVCRLPGAIQPSVVGRVEASGAADYAPTVAVYGHFDVQPPGTRTEWSTDPFGAEIRDGWIYGRGTADSKANSFIVLEAVKRLANSGSLPVNVQLLLDGEEEIDGVGIPDHVASEPPPDAAIICDGALWDDRTPSFATSLRGTLYYRVKLRAAERELHSGSFGGAALNAAGAMIECLYGASRGRIGHGRESSAELEALHDGPETLRRAGATPADDTAAERFYERTVLRSAIDVNSIGAGEIGLQKTAIPDEAVANVSVRIAPGDDLQRIDVEFTERMRQHAPAGAELSIETLAAVPPGETPTDSEAVNLGAGAFERVLGARPHFVGSGGTLPLFSVYADLGVPVITTGFATADGAAHAADERFPLTNLPLGIKAICETLRALGSLRR
jgi:acetylornithine deacetylase/succinyl-diaminopimelate desuccinylase-like protein